MRTVIVGGGLAGQRCAETLRRGGHDGPLTMVCAEPHLPYDRPPLSKEILLGTRQPAELAFRDEAWYVEHDVDLLLGTRAIGMSERHVETTGGAVPYDRLLVATGARPRALPMLEGFANVHTLRDLDDALALADEIGPGQRLAIVGAGFIGLEVAAAARSRGTRVTVIEAAPAPLAAVLGESVGGWFADWHRREGIEVLTGAGLVRAHGGRRVTALELADGRLVHTDAVLVAIGVQPATRWARPLPGVHFAGDAAGHHHWETAARGGSAAARAMLGQPIPAEPPASFWSDQHGVRIQLVGEPAGAERTSLEGDPDAADFAVTWWRGALPAAVLLVGRPGDLAQARRLVAGARTPERSAA